MKAAMLYKGGEVRVGDVPDPQPDGWAIVAVKAAGVCGSELHFLDGMIPLATEPFVMGHEIAGVVVDAGTASGIRAGDRVAVYNVAACGECDSCRAGRESLCVAPIGQLGWSLPGGFAELVRAPARSLVPLPDAVSFETGAVLACSGMSVVHASRLAGVGLGETAVVNGVGGVGLMAIQVVVAAGARAIAVADSADKGELALSIGASEVIVLEGGRGYEQLPRRVSEATGGNGAGYFFELVGTEETMLAGLRSLGRGGCFVSIGYTGENLVVNPIELILSELRIVSSVAASRSDLETAIRLAADGRLAVTIDTRYPIDEIGTALERLRARQVRGRNVIVW